MEGQEGRKDIYAEERERQAAEIAALRRTLAEIRGAPASSGPAKEGAATAEADWGESARNFDRWARPEGHRGWGETAASDSQGAGAAPTVVSEGPEAVSGDKGKLEEDSSEAAGAQEETVSHDEESEQEKATRLLNR